MPEVGFFFFSSRRRHTRCYRDWSSDVCSSDLTKRGECLLERLRRLAWAAGLEGSVGPADKEIGPLDSLGRGQLERLGEPRLRLDGIEAERPLAGEREEPPRGHGESAPLS